MMFDISVVVLTYNPSFEKLAYTLSSIVLQENISFEIIIADDGSKIFDQERVKAWFDSKGFTSYTLVLNPENKGTMHNALSGWRAATGRYIKQLSPGDCLYSPLSLYSALKIIDTTKSKLFFGMAVPYLIEQGKIKIYDKQNPKNLAPYYNQNNPEIKFNYVQMFDYVNGMAYICERNLLLKYGTELENKVKYAEDCTYILMVSDDIKITFIDEYLIWYEYGTGVSTGKSDIWKKRIAKDNRECYRLIASRHPEYNYIARYYFNADRSILIRSISKLMKIICNKSRRIGVVKVTPFEKDQCISNLELIINASQIS